jgi:hypothetical protein
MQSQWGECAPFSADATSEAMTPFDAMIFDNNASYQ